MAQRAAVIFLLAAACAAAVRAADTTHLHLFLHDVASGSNPTAVQVIKGPVATSGGGAIPGLRFGDMTVIDDALTEGSEATSAAVGRAQGFYMVSSLSGAVLMMSVNLLLTTGDYNGSTLAVTGRDDILTTVRELSVVGGTGKFRMATGYVLWKTNSSSGADATIELDVYVSTSPNGTADASAPVSPLDGGGGGGGTAGKSSSAAAPALGARGITHGWVNACVAGVLAAVVGGCVW